MFAGDFRGGSCLASRKSFAHLCLCAQRAKACVKCALTITPKALANLSPRLERATTLGRTNKRELTLKGFVFKANAFSVYSFFILDPGLSLRSNPGL